MTPFPALLDKVRPAQNSQVLRDCRPGDGKRARDFSRRTCAGSEQIKHGAAGGIGECAKGGFAGICNRSVTHKCVTLQLQELVVKKFLGNCQSSVEMSPSVTH